MPRRVCVASPRCGHEWCSACRPFRRVRWRSWENVITEVVHSLQTNNQPYHFSVYGCSANDAHAQTRERGPTDVVRTRTHSLYIREGASARRAPPAAAGRTCPPDARGSTTRLASPRFGLVATNASGCYFGTVQVGPLLSCEAARQHHSTWREGAPLGLSLATHDVREARRPVRPHHRCVEDAPPDHLCGFVSADGASDAAKARAGGTRPWLTRRCARRSRKT